MSKTYQVVGVGNALVDVLAQCDEDFLATNEVEKGVMQLIDTARATELYSKMDATQEISGGSAANTIFGISALGGRTGFMAKVRNDPLGHVFADSMRAQGTDFTARSAPKDHPTQTGRCLIFVTPDGERSMNTYLGVSSEFSSDDLDMDMLADTDWVYLEGYLFDSPANQDAFGRAMETAQAAGGQVALTLSDPFCVDRHREAFRALIQNHVDVLFCNEHELKSLYHVETVEAALDLSAPEAGIVVCTVGENGAYILKGGEILHVPAIPTSVVDATGAGDLFAAGFLYGLITGSDLACCGHMGCVAASEVISHMGARPQKHLKVLFAEHGFMSEAVSA